MTQRTSTLVWVVLCGCASAAAVYSFSYSDDPHYAASCKVADYVVYSVAALGGINGFIQFVILRHPVPKLRSFLRGRDQ